MISNSFTSSTPAVLPFASSPDLVAGHSGVGVVEGSPITALSEVLGLLKVLGCTGPVVTKALICIVAPSTTIRYIEFFTFDYDSLPISFQSRMAFFL